MALSPEAVKQFKTQLDLMRLQIQFQQQLLLAVLAAHPDKLKVAAHFEPRMNKLLASFEKRKDLEPDALKRLRHHCESALKGLRAGVAVEVGIRQAATEARGKPVN